MTSDVLTLRALNRATLARQWLLERVDETPLAAVDHLVGLQAQVPQNPYVALWSRLRDFDPAALSRLIADRHAGRIVSLRGTIHLVTAEDALAIRPLVQPVLDAELARHPDVAPALVGVDLASVIAHGRELLAEPHTVPRLRAALAERVPDVDPAALAYVCRNHLALVQVPPRGLWGRSGQVTLATAETWFGRTAPAPLSVDELVLRYLAAFGPATPGDVSTWSRLTGMAEVLERLRGRLRVLRDERGRELFDLPDAPRPDPDTPAPVRYLPEYDNVLLSHADRSRFGDAPDRTALGRGSVLVDGTVAGWWSEDKDTVTVTVETRPLNKRTGAAVEREGRALARFLHPEQEPTVVVRSLGG